MGVLIAGAIAGLLVLFLISGVLRTLGWMMRHPVLAVLILLLLLCNS
jgi:hypothetical protein